MKIRFTESRWLDTEDRTKTPKFKEGSTHDLSDASAHRWTRRGYAVYVVEEAPSPLKVGRPMMKKPAVAEKPPKKPKGDATVREIKTGPSLPVKGSGKNGGPGWDDV